MTSGIREFGNVSYGPPDYFFKQWNGEDGKYIDGTKIREILTLPHVLKLNPYQTRIIKQQYTLGPLGGCIPPWTDGANWMELPPNFELRLLEKLTNKINGIDFSLGNDIGEAAKTLRMLEKTALKAGSCIWNLRHLRFEEAARSLGDGVKAIKTSVKWKQNKLTLSDVSSFWLEMEYGWKPLLSDLFQATAVMDLASQTRNGHRVATKGSYRATTTGTDLEASPPRFVWARICDYSIKYIAYVKEMYSSPEALGLTDPISIAWEVTPFSFIVDWFTPIQSYLKERVQVGNVNVRLVTNKRSVTYTTALGWAGYEPFDGSRTDRQDVVFGRSIGDSLPKPPLPQFQNPFSWIHAANALAILHQLTTTAPQTHFLKDVPPRILRPGYIDNIARLGARLG